MRKSTMAFLANKAAADRAERKAVAHRIAAKMLGDRPIEDLAELSRVSHWDMCDANLNELLALARYGLDCMLPADVMAQRERSA